MELDRGLAKGHRWSRLAMAASWFVLCSLALTFGSNLAPPPWVVVIFLSASLCSALSFFSFAPKVSPATEALMFGSACLAVLLAIDFFSIKLMMLTGSLFMDAPDPNRPGHLMGVTYTPWAVLAEAAVIFRCAWLALHLWRAPMLARRS